MVRVVEQVRLRTAVGLVAILEQVARPTRAVAVVEVPVPQAATAAPAS
jgi:hypothetical protein